MAVTISPAELPGGSVEEEYSQTLSAQGGTGPYTYAVTVGSPPADITLGSDGLLHGTPSAAATSTFTVTATDSTAATGVQAYTLTIVEDLVAGIVCPSYQCQTVGSVSMIDRGDGVYTCPRCEQQSIVSGGVATLRPGYHA